jgi:hypothetical protein
MSQQQLATRAVALPLYRALLRSCASIESLTSFRSPVSGEWGSYSFIEGTAAKNHYSTIEALVPGLAELPPEPPLDAAALRALVRANYKSNASASAASAGELLDQGACGGCCVLCVGAAEEKGRERRW